jgi:glycerol kinase
VPGSRPLILSIDQGTSSTKALVVDAGGRIIARGAAPLALQTPMPGWVQHDAMAVIESCVRAVDDVLAQVDSAKIVAIGISNQRESLVVWERATGTPLSTVLSWQDRRTTETCARLWEAGHGPAVRRISGLHLDPMFSAAKAAWLLDEVDPSRARSRAGELCLGTIDSWLLWHLSGEHLIEAGNASRTSLLDIETGAWSDELLSIFSVPLSVLPRIIPSAGMLATTRGFSALPDGIPVTGVLGDSHAALFAHAGWRPGITKVTYGTGSSLMRVSNGTNEVADGLCRTVAWSLPAEGATLAWEANILSTGATLVWMASLLGTSVDELVRDAADDSGGVTLVPAFNGLGAPWWDNDAQALMLGMSLATSRRELARAALDSIVHQVADVVSTLAGIGAAPTVLVADGGMSANRMLMQRQADMCAASVEVASTAELSALGAAHAAGVGCGMWTISELEAMPREYESFSPVMDATARERMREGWRGSVVRSLSTEQRVKPHGDQRIHEMHDNQSLPGEPAEGRKS